MAALGDKCTTLRSLANIAAPFRGNPNPPQRIVFNGLQVAPQQSTVAVAAVRRIDVGNALIAASAPARLHATTPAPFAHPAGPRGNSRPCINSSVAPLGSPTMACLLFKRYKDDGFS